MFMRQKAIIPLRSGAGFGIRIMKPALSCQIRMLRLVRCLQITSLRKAGSMLSCRQMEAESM